MVELQWELTLRVVLQSLPQCHKLARRALYLEPKRHQLVPLSLVEMTVT